MTRVMRTEVVKQLNEQRNSSKAIVVAGAGCGISAKCEEVGGADLIVLESAGYFRMAGHGSLGSSYSFVNSNHLLLKMAEDMIGVVRHTPVIAGVMASDPLINIDKFLNHLIDLGFSGVINSPSVADFELMDSDDLESIGLGFSTELKMIENTVALGLFTIGNCRNAEQAKAMAVSGADMIVARMGLTSKGLVGSRYPKSLADCVACTQVIADAAKSVNKNILILCNGGPLADAESIQYLLDNTKGVSGFFGGSAIERIPAEEAIIQTARDFKATRLHQGRVGI